MKKRILLYFSLCLFITSKAQNNLVPNGSFEDIISCPSSAIYTSQLPLASPWQTPTNGTPDLFSTCDTANTYGNPPIFHVPKNAGGYQQPHTGNNYAGIYDWATNHSNVTCPSCQEYIQVQLINSLIKGKKYCVSFFASLAEMSNYATSRVGSLISILPVSNYTAYVINAIPQIENPFHSYLNDTINWTRIKGLYIATGGESYITIGNFYDESNTDTIYMAGLSKSIYYYLDDVSLVEYDTAYAGNDTSICKGLKIPLGTVNSFGASYNWSVISGDANSIIDSSAISSVYVKPNITTVYKLQKYQCGIFSYDTVTVYIKPTYTANAGPDASICIGDGAVIGTPAICTLCTYNWQNIAAPYQNTPQLTVYPLANTLYTLALKDSCFTTYSSVTVDVAYCQSPVVSVPNIFSPNADGINDSWQLIISSGALSILNYQCTVYDRWGAKVFDSSTSPGMTGNAWDGHTTSGLAASEGTYYYVISYTDAKTNEPKNLKGFLELVR